MNVGRQLSQGLRVQAKCLRLEMRCPFHFREEFANCGRIAARFGWLGCLRSKFIDRGGPAFRQEGQINVTRFDCRLLLVRGIQIETFADAFKVDSD